MSSHIKTKEVNIMSDQISFAEAINPLLSSPWFIGAVVVIVIAIVYLLFVKKDKRLKAVIISILQESIQDAYDKGMQVEFVVDDIIAKAIKKIKEKPDKWDGILLYVVQAKWFRNKLISITKTLIEKIAQAEPDAELTKVDQ